ncbi:MAG: hypothetical protein GWP91_03395 [Rhodobacterales bacterium]|nr:hypothetical protein [Rhodobacterales bacterium]
MYEFSGSFLSLDGGLTLAAPIVAIFLALLSKRVIPSLMVAALVGALVAADADPMAGVTMLISQVGSNLVDADNLTISAFSLLVAATVGVMGRAGGTRALVSKVERFAKGRRGAMIASWLAGAIVFFDDYANCLIVGSSMGPLCDRFRVSRAKLAYIVDATAAPVASLAIVSTWVGYEVGLLQDVLPAGDISPFSVFLAALPYRFYCLFTIAFVGTIAITGRDFGPMAEAEREAAKTMVNTEKHEEAHGTYASLAVVPIGILVGLTFVLLYTAGVAELGEKAATSRMFEIIGAANPYPPMLYGSIAAFTAATLAALGSKAIKFDGVLQGIKGGTRPVFEALAVLYLAWILGDLIKEAGTGEYLAASLSGTFDPWMLPVATFALASLTAFSVGSSFFTMGALIPLVFPLALAAEGGVVGPIVLASCAAVLDGAVLGDHASPISDTTILSALGSNVDVVTHVRTQLPYVAVVGVIAILCGSIPAGLGYSPWLLIPIGIATAIATVHLLGRVPVAENAPPIAAAN